MQKRKILVFITAALLLFVAFFAVVIMFGSKQFLAIYSREKVLGRKNSWRLLEQNTKQELGAVLLALATDNGLRDEYLSGDKDKLYRYAGPLFADDPEIADKLFQKFRSFVGEGTPIFLDTPEVNKAAVKLAEKYQIKPMFETARMYTKGKPNIDLQRVFGVTIFELG